MDAELLRSYLYVPGTQEDRIAKALGGEADAVVIDLEDAVAPASKRQARRIASEVVSHELAKPVFVRVNALGGGLGEADVAAVIGPGLSGIRIPKTDSADHVRRVVGWLAEAHSDAAVVPLVESALGVERAFVIASADERVTAIAMGEADLRADLGVSSDDGLVYARSRCVTAARAAGRVAVQSVFPDLRDLAALRASTERGRSLGFAGRSAIHPAQVAVINDVLTPTDDEVRRARELMGAYEAALEGGSAATTTSDGRFVDEAVLRSARSILRLAARSRPA